MNTYSQRKTFVREGARDLNNTINQAQEALTAQQEAQYAENRAEYAKRHAAVPFSLEQLAAATHVRSYMGWHKVVKVNVKSVTVETGYSWHDRLAIAKLLEVRTLPALPPVTEREQP